ncbi:MAG: HEAT repeat domain-containing protein [Candidatus Heimdallarchaeota archaeon]|nr:HEAT repeat domain-containing protein [Candidatus Heimdallarchaeota archaeon]
MTIAEDLKVEIDRLFSDEPDIRKAAAMRLGRIRDTKSVEALIMAAQTDENPITRIFAIQSLLWIGDDRAIEFLVNISLDDKDKSVRIAAIQAFAPFKDSRILKVLEQLQQSPDNEIAETATQTFRLIIYGHNNYPTD